MLRKQLPALPQPSAYSDQQLHDIELWRRRQQFARRHTCPHYPAGLLVPILALAHEHHPDPEMRPYKEPISAEMRERLIIGAAAGVMVIYDLSLPKTLSN